MLQQKSKGSILIVSLIIFSIISLICVTCSGLILSNNRISDLEYKTEKLKEENIGAIELVHSNILKEIKDAIDNTKTEDEFYNYLTRNNSNMFINKVKNINISGLDNMTVNMGFDKDLSTKQYIHYKMSTKSKIDNHDKYALVKVRIENPWFGIEEENVQNSFQDNGDSVELSTEMEKETIVEDKIIDINEGNLVTFYNYEEK